MLNDSNSKESKFDIKKSWYLIDSQAAEGKCKQGDFIKFQTKSIKSSICDYSDAFILVARDIKVNAGNDTHVAFKTCALFST